MVVNDLNDIIIFFALQSVIVVGDLITMTDDDGAGGDREMPQGEVSLVAKTFKSRMKCNPMLGVADIMKPFEKWFAFYNSKDLRKVLDAPPDMDWKSAPHAKWLTKQQVLFSGLLDIAPNAMITSHKLKETLHRLNEEGGVVNSTKKDDSILWDFADTKVRIGLAQLRELKRNREMCLDRAIRKLSDLERHTLQSMLDKIHFVNQDKSTGNENSPTTAGLGTTTCTTTTGQGNGSATTKQPVASMALVASSCTTPSPKESGVATSTPEYGECTKKGGQQEFVSSLSSKPSQHEIQSVFTSILGKDKKQKEAKRPLSGPTSSDASTPDKSLISLKKRLSFEEEDEEENEEYGTNPKIKILPAGEKLMMEKKKKKDQVEEGTKESGQVKKQKKDKHVDGCTATSREGFFLDSLLDSYVGRDAESATPVKKKEKEDKKNAKRESDDDDDDGASSSFLDSVSRSMCVFVPS